MEWDWGGEGGEGGAEGVRDRLSLQKLLRSIYEKIIDGSSWDFV